MVDLELFLYAYPDEDNDISDMITCMILDGYIQDHHLNFDADTFKTEKQYIKAAKKFVNELKEFIKTSDYAISLIKLGVEYVELTVEYIDGPEVISWTVWERPKR